MDQERELERKCELGYLQRAEGSCFYGFGHTTVMAAVNGPGDVKSSRQLIDRATIETNFHRAVAGPSNDRTQMILQNVLESCLLVKQFPKCSIAVTVQEMHNDGCLCSSTINSTCLALLDAGLPMRGLFAAVECLILRTKEGEESTEGNFLLNPDLKSETDETCTAKFLLVFESRGLVIDTNPGDEVDLDEPTPSLLFCNCDGTFTRDQFKSAVDKCALSAQEIFEFYRSVITRKYSRRLEFVDDMRTALIEK